MYSSYDVLCGNCYVYLVLERRQDKDLAYAQAMAAWVGVQLVGCAETNLHPRCVVDDLAVACQALWLTRRTVISSPGH